MPDSVDVITPVAEPSFAELRTMLSESEKEPAAAAETVETTPAGSEEETDPKTEPASEPEDKQERDEQGKFKAKEEPKEGADPEVPVSVQKRIDKAVAKQREAERRAAEAEQKLQELQGGKTAEKAPEAEAKPVRPKQEDFESWEAYQKAEDEYIEKAAAWAVDQKSKAESAKAEADRVKADQAKALEDFQASCQATAKQFPDFEKVISAIDDIQIPHYLTEEVMASEQSGLLAYNLAKDRAELERIVSLPPAKALRELGKFEARLTPVKQATTKTVTDAPKPPAKAAGGPAPKVLDAKDYQDLPLKDLKRELNKRR